MTAFSSFLDRHPLAFAGVSLGTIFSAETIAQLQQLDVVLSVAVRSVSLAIGICSLLVLLRRLVGPFVVLLRRRRQRGGKTL